MPSTFTCPECGSDVEVVGDALVCKSCGREAWKTEGARAERLLSVERDYPLERLVSEGGGEKASQAETAYRDAIETCRGYAKDNPDAFRPYLSSALNNLGVLLFYEGRDGEAEALYLEAIGIQRELAGRAPGVFLAALPQKLVNYADLLKRDGRFDGALAHYREALDLWIRIAAARSLIGLPEAAKTMATIATLLVDLGRKDDAEEYKGMAHELRWAFQEVKEVLR